MFNNTLANNTLANNTLQTSQCHNQHEEKKIKAKPKASSEKHFSPQVETKTKPMMKKSIKQERPSVINSQVYSFHPACSVAPDQVDMVEKRVKSKSSTKSIKTKKSKLEKSEKLDSENIVDTESQLLS